MSALQIGRDCDRDKVLCLRSLGDHVRLAILYTHCLQAPVNGPSDCRYFIQTIDLSQYRPFGLLTLRTIDPSDY